MKNESGYPPLFLVLSIDGDKGIYYDYKQHRFYEDRGAKAGVIKLDWSFGIIPFIVGLFYITDRNPDWHLAVMVTVIAVTLIGTPVFIRLFMRGQQRNINGFINRLAPMEYMLSDEEMQKAKKMFNGQKVILAVMVVLSVCLLLMAVFIGNFFYGLFFSMAYPVLYALVVIIRPMDKERFFRTVNSEKE